MELENRSGVEVHATTVRRWLARLRYVIRDYPECAFVDYLERELARMKANKPRGTDDAHGHLMKSGPDPNHWNEYVFSAFSDYQHDAIFLTGIPDIRQSLPHASAYR